MADRYDQDRERNERDRGYDSERNRENQGPGARHYGREENEGWRGESQAGPNSGYEGNRGSWGNEGRSGSNQGEGSHEGRFSSQGGFSNQGRYGGMNREEDGRHGYNREQGEYSRQGGNYGQGYGNREQGWTRENQGWDRERDMGYGDMQQQPRQNEWSSGHGVGAGLGGAENPEYRNRMGTGNYFGAQGQFGGGLSQYGNQGRHSGRGPKGYKRSDERIKEDVSERLTQDPEVDASEIEIQVKDGEVTLTGSVENRQSKRRAEDAIENVSGVREVHNQLRVQQNAGNSHGSASPKGGTQEKESQARR